MTTLSRSETAQPAIYPVWRTIGFWIAIVLIAYSGFNVVRSLTNPAAFAESYGLPTPDNVAFITVYSLRTLFITLVAAGLLVTQRYGALALYALLATVLSVGDALLVASHGGSTGEIGRHLTITAFLIVTWFFVRRLARSRAA